MLSKMSNPLPPLLLPFIKHVLGLDGLEWTFTTFHAEH